MDIYILDNKKNLNFLEKVYKIDKKLILNNDIVGGFLGNLKYIIVENEIKYIIQIIEKNNIVHNEYDYDTIIVSNNELVDENTKYFYYYNLKYDDKYLKDKNDVKKIWYFYYFKRNIDILLLINTFEKMQNIDAKWYIGKYKNYDELKVKVKNYFNFLFGKYNFMKDQLDVFVKLIDLYYRKETILFSKLKLLFIDFPFMLDYFNSPEYNIQNFYLFYVKNDSKYFIINNYTINILFLNFYYRSYINFLNNEFKYDKELNDIINLKYIYMYSMCKLKINEYTKLISMILHNHHNNIDHLIYDFNVENNNIEIVKYESSMYVNIEMFIKNKYKNL